MEEDYLDRSVAKEPSPITIQPENGDNDAWKLKMLPSSQPTTSINLNQTLFQAMQADNSNSGNNIPLSYYDLQTINTSAGSLNTTITNSISNEFFYSELASIHTNINNDWKKPIVSKEIPNVFKIHSKVISSIEQELIDIDTNFLILTSAGKPIYSFCGKDEQLTSIMGIINTIINYFKINDSKDLKSIKSGNQVLTFLNKSPVILMAYSNRGESTSELFDQLDFLYSYLISSLSERQVLRLFNKRENFDLRNFLEASDFENLDSICSLITNKFYPDLYLGALRCLPLENHLVRRKIHELMSKHLLKESSLPRGTLLYGLLVYPDNKLVSVLRPKRHTLHTTDLHLLLCLIFNRFQNLDENQELWVPICFPKFNSNGFLYCYIKFLSNNNQANPTQSKNLQLKRKAPALVLISAQKDVFYPLKELATTFLESMKAKKLLDQVIHSNGIKTSDIRAPLVHHFIYKSKKHVQYITPEFEYKTFSSSMSDTERNTDSYELKLKLYYQHLYNSVINQETGLPLNKSILNYIKWEATPEDAENTTNTEEDLRDPSFKEELANILGLAWVTPKFELYLISNNDVNNKDILFKSARKIAFWCNKNESRLFVTEGSVF